MNIDYKAENEEIQRKMEHAAQAVFDAVKPPRFEHSLRVAQTAVHLCRRYGVNADLGFFAGLTHDLCKDMDDQTVMNLAKKDGLRIGGLEKEKPSLLHGRAAAILLASDFLLTDEDLLDAVRNHTFGCPHMSDLAVIVYIADKIEPGRNYDTGIYARLIPELPLNALAAHVVRQNIGFLTERQKAVSPLSRTFLRSLEKRHY